MKITLVEAPVVRGEVNTAAAHLPSVLDRFHWPGVVRFRLNDLSRESFDVGCGGRVQSFEAGTIPGRKVTIPSRIRKLRENIRRRG